MLTVREIKFIVGLVVVIILAVIFKLWLNNRDEARDNEANLAQAGRTNQAATDIANNASEAAADRGVTERQVITERIYIERQQETLRNENPAVMDWSNGVIPVELRNADREARIARKRLSDNGSGIETDSKPAND